MTEEKKFPEKKEDKYVLKEIVTATDVGVGLKEEEVRVRDHSPEELSFYSKATTDLEFLFFLENLSLYCIYKKYLLKTLPLKYNVKIYKTKYNDAGDVETYDVNGSPNIEGGDKIRKVILGLSNTVGFDQDLLKYKGASGTTETFGFHLSTNASTIVD